MHKFSLETKKSRFSNGVTCKNGLRFEFDYIHENFQFNTNKFHVMNLFTRETRCFPMPEFDEFKEFIYEFDSCENTVIVLIE
jgi:hypothetical protein